MSGKQSLFHFPAEGAMIKALCELFLLENYTRNFAIPIQYFGGSICVVVLLIDKKIQASSFTLPEVAIRSKAADWKIRTESQK